MWCSRALGHFIVCLRCLTLTLFVVAGGTFRSHCISSMLDFDAICGVPAHLAILLFAFDAWLWRYLWCSRALGHFIVCLRCLTLTLFVVAGSTFRSHCFSSMLDFDAICRGRTHFWKSLLAFDAWFWRWATYRISVSFLNAVEFRNALEQLIFSQRSASLKLISMLSSQLVWDM